MSKVRFPHTLHAVEARERHLGVAGSSALWHLGEALKKDIRPKPKNTRSTEIDIISNKNNTVLLTAAAAELEEHGYREYSPNYLARILTTTEAFPPNRRHMELSFSIHVQAHNPEILDWIVKSSGRTKTKVDDKDRITERFVKDMVDAWYRRIAEKQEAVDAEKQEAQPPKKGKVKKVKKHKGKKTTKRTMAPPDDAQSTSDIVNEIIVLKELDVLRNAREARRLAEKAEERIAQAVDKLDQNAVDVLAEACLAAMTAWKQVSDTVRSLSDNKRSHLTSIKGGAA